MPQTKSKLILKDTYYTKYLLQPQQDEVRNQKQKENWNIHKFVEIRELIGFLKRLTKLTNV